jgi:1,6-anhydro-N-acetylmuramate kinase
MTRLNYEAGAVYAHAALELTAQENVSGESLFVIGYDSQTVYQEPPDHDRMASLPADAPLLWRLRVRIPDPAAAAAVAGTGHCWACSATVSRPR